MRMFLRYKHGKSLWSKNGEGAYWGKYVGKVNDGKPNGKGECSYDKGRGIYKGSWRDGERHGKGTYTNRDGRKYVGEWKKGLRHGKGTNISSKGIKYSGSWKDGMFHGQGKLTNPNGEEYVGKWKNGKEWNTKHTKKDGTLVGKYKKGEKIFGVLGRRLGDRYRGKYEGEWYEEEDEKKGCTYVGEIKNGKPNGRGTFTLANGNKYIGYHFT